MVGLDDSNVMMQFGHVILGFWRSLVDDCVAVVLNGT